MNAKSLRRHNKRCIDAVISRTFAELRRDRGTWCAFAGLLAAVQQRSDLAHAVPGRDGRFAEVDALRNLAVFHREISGDPFGWSGLTGHPLRVIGSLARHVLGRYPTPHFLGSVWFGGDTRRARERRQWFVEHARGRPFRRLALPIALTRRMEHHFLQSPDHLEVECAMRRAEVLGLGGTPELADAIVRTRLGGTFADPGLWRAVLRCLVRCGDALPLADVAAIVAYVAAVADVSTSATAETVALVDAAAPGLALSPRSLAAVIRAAVRWRAGSVHVGGGGRFSWPKSRWRDFACELFADDGGYFQWRIVELLDSDALAGEARAMRSCVATYAHRCRRGWSTIWSLRRVEDGELSSRLSEPASVLTIEVDPRNGTIVQVRGPRNRRGTDAELAIVRQWAARAELGIGAGAWM